MKVYLHSDNAERSSRYPVHICPAGDTDFVKSADVLEEWRLADGQPRQFEIIFKNGVAEVETSLGKYMVARGIAAPSRLVRVLRQLFTQDGKPVDVSVEDGELVLKDAV